MEPRPVQQALKDAEFRLQSLPDAELRAIVRAMLTLNHAGVLVSGPDDRVMACNQEFGRIFGIDPDAAPGAELETLRMCVYPRLENPEAWRDRLAQTYADPLSNYTDEFELLHPTAWVRRTTQPLADTDGAVLGRLWVFEDLTLERARQLRREVVQRISMFHHPDPAVVCQAVTRAVADLYKTTTILSIAQGENMVFRDVALPPPGTDDVRGNLIKDSFCQLVMEDGRPVLVQDGRLHPRVCNILPVQLGFVRYLGVPLLNSEGSSIGTLCIMDGKCEELLGEEDSAFMAVMGNRISVELERERLFNLRTEDQRIALARQEVELAHTRKVLRAMIAAATLVELAKDEPDLIARLQQGLQGVLGFEGVHFHEGPPRHDGSLAETWSLDADVFSLELWAGTEPMTREYTQTHASALADHLALTLATFRLQRKLLQAHEELRAAQGKLVQTEKLAVVGALAATIAHDIRNIMSSIALEAESEGDPAEVLLRVRQQVGRFTVLSHRLLSYVKPKFMAQEPIQVNEVIRRALDLLEPQVRVSGVSLTVNLDAQAPAVVADPSQLEHLLVNLIVNALQAVNRSGGTLEVASQVEDGHLVCRITDNGRGIPPAKLAHIFDPFYSSRPDGVGLGLFSCKRISDEHGWRLEAESRPTIGSQFSLRIPIEADLEREPTSC